MSEYTITTQQERSACRICGMLQRRCFKSAYDLLPPRFRGEGDGRPLYEAEIEPGRLVMAARSSRSVRLWPMISEPKHGQAPSSTGAYPLNVRFGSEADVSSVSQYVR